MTYEHQPVYFKSCFIYVQILGWLVLPCGWKWFLCRTATGLQWNLP